MATSPLGHKVALAIYFGLWGVPSSPGLVLAQRQHEHVLPAMYQIHIEQHKAPHIATGVQSERPTFGEFVYGSSTLPDALQAVSQVYGVSDSRT